MIYKSGSPMRATFLQCMEKIMKFFQKKTQNQDQFKRLIHRLSEMSDSELTKVKRILRVFQEELGYHLDEYEGVARRLEIFIKILNNRDNHKNYKILRN